MASSADTELELVLVREFAAPRELVFACWTEPARMALWHAPEGFDVTAEQVDVREGGHYRVRMVDADGVTYGLHGEYREVTPPARLVLTHQWDEPGSPETLLELDFEDLGARTRLHLRQSGFTRVSSRDGHGEGWASTLDRLGGYLATTGAQP
jgi:uncharacterized protein YndB with AHSA1/START domain